MMRSITVTLAAAAAGAFASMGQRARSGALDATDRVWHRRSGCSCGCWMASGAHLCTQERGGRGSRACALLLVVRSRPAPRGAM